MLSKTLGNSSLPVNSINRGIATPVAATAAVITLAAVSGQRHVIDSIQWSYSAAPTGGRLTISDGTTRLDLDITAAGPGALSCNIQGDANVAVVVTLASGAGAVVGKLSTQSHIEAT